MSAIRRAPSPITVHPSVSRCPETPTQSSVVQGVGKTNLIQVPVLTCHLGDFSGIEVHFGFKIIFFCGYG